MRALFALLAILLLSYVSLDVVGFVFEPATGVNLGGNTHRVAFPKGYATNLNGGTLTITVGIKTGDVLANQMTISIKNAIKTWNERKPTIGNIKRGNVPSDRFDFESVVLQEIGRCLGLGYGNIGTKGGLSGANTDYTNTLDGVPNLGVNLAPGADGVIGSKDDINTVATNVFFFHRGTNNPFRLNLGTVDSTTYSVNEGQLPAGDNSPANGNVNVAGLLNAKEN